MKIYNMKKDEYGQSKDFAEYIRDKKILSGKKWEVHLEMKIWNFIAKIVNLRIKI